LLVPQLDGLAPAASASDAEARQWLASAPEPLPGLAEHTAYVVALTTAGYYPEDETGLVTSAGLDPDIVVFETRPDWLEGCDLSWWGGPAVAPTPVWPCRRDGQPLAHVLSVHLGEVQCWEDDVYEAWGSPPLWLPDQGVLQVFSDRRTDGFGADDGQLGAWQVRWIVPDEPRALVEPPAGAQLPHGHLVDGWEGFMVPAACDLPADLPGRDAADEVNVALARAWDWQVHHRTLEQPPATSHLYGHSSRGYQPVAKHLDRVLPCEPGDRHRLVAELVPGPVLPGWFADEVHLEVWMRESDLQARAFDAAWCLLRVG
jgi:hypothetical protein